MILQRVLSWFKKWFSISWKKLFLITALVPLMWLCHQTDFPRVDTFIRDALQFLNDPDEVDKSIVTVNINGKNINYERPFKFDEIKKVIDTILAKNPKNLILCFSPLEFNGEDSAKIGFKQELLKYLEDKKNVYLYSSGFADKNDMATDRELEKYPRFFKIIMISDRLPSVKHRRSLTRYDSTGEAPEFEEMRKLGFQVKDYTHFKYGLYFWNTTQPYIKTYPLKAYGSHDAYEFMQNIESTDLTSKTVILGSNDEFSMLSTESVFNLLGRVGDKDYKDFPPADSLANYMNLFVNGEYLKLVPKFDDIIFTSIVLILLILLNLPTKSKLYFFVSVIPVYCIFVFLLYLCSSFYIDFSRSITGLFFLQYFAIPIGMLNLFKEQESKKLQEINDARIDALLTVSEKVAHDIRSPLSAINMVIGNADFRDPEYKEIFDSAVQRIDETATKILTRYRTRTGKENSAMEVVNLKEIIEAIVKEKKVLNAKIDFSINCELHASTTLAQKLDMERIISNILDNSIFALKNHSQPKITLNLNVDNQMTQLVIADNGTGIPIQVLELLGKERITTKAETGQGNGIGLLHAKRTIEKFNGKFVILSEENKGTEIKISLPKAKET